MNREVHRRRAPRLLVLAAALCACGPEEHSPTPPAKVPMHPSEAALVVDVRPPEEFAAGHVPGAINLQWSFGQLAERAAAYAPDRERLVAVDAGDERTAERAAALLRERGYERVALHLAPERRSATLAVCTAAELRAELARADPPVVLDVRTPSEWARGTIADAVLLEQDEAPARAAELDRTRRYAVICEGGYRSSQLASFLVREGFPDVVNVLDGMAGWRSLDGR